MVEIISFDAERVSRYIEHAFLGFSSDPADSDYQRGYLAALLVLYREGLGKDMDEGLLALLTEQTKHPC